jgi:hypothetical protein
MYSNKIQVKKNNQLSEEHTSNHAVRQGFPNSIQHLHEHNDSEMEPLIWKLNLDFQTKG